MIFPVCVRVFLVEFGFPFPKCIPFVVRPSKVVGFHVVVAAMVVESTVQLQMTGFEMIMHIKNFFWRGHVQIYIV